MVPRHFAEIEESEDRYIDIPFQGSAVGYEGMNAFAQTVRDAGRRGCLDAALVGKGAFRRFQDALLDAPAERDRWFTFQRDRVAARIQRWALSVGIEAAARPRPAR